LLHPLHPLHPPAAAGAAFEAHRHATNAAFHELDLQWYWDAATFARVQPYGRAGLRDWVRQERPHLLRAYDLDFLVDAIEQVRARCLARIATGEGALQPSPPSRRAA